MRAECGACRGSWLTPRADPTKFFGCELGAQTTFDEKADRYIVNGAHQADALRKLLDDFIAKFVLCGSCKNPETDLKIMKDGMILRDCKACGKRSDVDMRHKLTTFITKNPPPKKAKGAKGAGKAAGQSVEAQGGDDDDAKSDEDDFTAKINADAKDMPKANEAEDEEFRGNLVVKEELLVEAEKLVPVTDFRSARKALRDLQERWEAAGKVPRADLQRVEKRLRAVEQAVSDAERATWKRTNPEVKARADSAVEQLERAVAGLEADLAAAQAKGDARAESQARAALEARRLWLDAARRTAEETSA